MPVYKFVLKGAEDNNTMGIEEIIKACELVNQKILSWLKSRVGVIDDWNLKHIPIHFFSNGIKVNNAVFYPYVSKEAHDFVKDINDGFLPGFLR